MKWQVILPVVAMLCLAFVPQAALAHHHHCGYGGGYGNGYGGGYGGGMNPFLAQRMMMMNRGYGGGYGGYGNGYGGYGNSYGGYGNRYGNGMMGNGMMSGFGRLMHGL